jgi:hypothetical protein
MKHSLNIPQIIQKIPGIDQEFAELLATQASTDLLKAFLVRNYLPIAYIFAVRLRSPHGYSEHEDDRIAGDALEVIDNFARQIDEDSVSFRAETRFSTYLLSALRRVHQSHAYIARAALESDESPGPVSANSPCTRCARPLQSGELTGSDTRDSEYLR